MNIKYTQFEYGWIIKRKNKKFKQNSWQYKTHMVIYSQQNKQDLITQDFQSNQAVGKPIGNKEKLGVSRNWMRRGGTVQWDDK